MSAEGSYGYAYTGASNSLIHVAKIEPWQTHALCGTGIGGSVSEYRPSLEQLAARLCIRCRREANRRGVDAHRLGYREAVDGA